MISSHFVLTEDSRLPPSRAFIEINLTLCTRVYYFYDQQLAEEKQRLRIDNLMSYSTLTKIMF
jgi:hypothetical protein